MKNMMKILIGVSVLLICLSMVSAADPVDIFTAPSPLLPLGTSSFADGEGHNIMINEYTDDNAKTWFENDTNYVVQKYNDTCYIGADDENDCYILEIVEKDGTKYIIGSWTPKGVGETTTIQENLENFNEMNKLTPLSVEG